VVIDYEGAWHELAAFAASKTQHGREGLLVEMTRIAQDHRVAAGELPRLLRLYSIEVERVRSTHLDGDEANASSANRHLETFSTQSPLIHSPADAALSRHHDRGGPDGRNDCGASDDDGGTRRSGRSVATAA
jgi:hypothetical protein